MVAGEAIPVIVDGIQYRSKVEGAWAKMLSLCEIQADYEPQGYRISSRRAYLPDFWLHGLNHYLEIKASEPETVEMNRLRQDAKAIGNIVLVWGGPVNHVLWDGDDRTCTGRLVSSDGHIRKPYQLCFCPTCGSVGWGLGGDGSKIIGHGCKSKPSLTWQGPSIRYFATAAHHAVRWSR